MGQREHLSPHALDSFEAAGIWWYLVREWSVEHHEIEHTDFMEGLTAGCRVEVWAEWRDMPWEGEITPEGDRLRFLVKGGRERRLRFRELEEQISAAIPLYVTKLRPAAAKTPKRIRVSPLAC